MNANPRPSPSLRPPLTSTPGSTPSREPTPSEATNACIPPLGVAATAYAYGHARNFPSGVPLRGSKSTRSSVCPITAHSAMPGCHMSIARRELTASDFCHPAGSANPIGLLGSGSAQKTGTPTSTRSSAARSERATYSASPSIMWVSRSMPK